MVPRYLAPSPMAALPLLLALLLCATATLALPFPSASPIDAGDANAEMDSDATQRVLGSSVVTSVSVIMDLGNGTKVLTEPGPMPRPGERIPAVASPASLMHPDRYEFYTFDEAGDLVKRYMTLPQIQSMIAGGDGAPSAAVSGGLPLQPLGEGRVPVADAIDAPPAPPGVVIADHQGAPTALGVREVVDRVQNVLRSELEANKNKVPTPGTSAPTAPLADESSDSSGAWSVLLPAMMGSAVDNASSSTSAVPTTPTPVTRNATSPTATTTTTTQVPTTKVEEAPQQTTDKAVPTEAPTVRDTEPTPSKPAPTVPSPTEVPTTILPEALNLSTQKESPTKGSASEIVTETSMSASFSSSLSGSSESDESSPESGEETSASTSRSPASESEESQEASTEVNAAPADTQSPHDDETLSKPPQTPPATAQVPSSPFTRPQTSPTTTPQAVKTTFSVSSETPMLLTVVEPSPETPILIPVFEPSPPTPLDDLQNSLKSKLPQRPLRPIVVPEIPSTTPESEIHQQSADQSQEKPVEVVNPVPSSSLLPPIPDKPFEQETTQAPSTALKIFTTPALPEENIEKLYAKKPESAIQVQKVPTLFLGLLPPFPDPLEESPSMPDDIPLLLDSIVATPSDSPTESNPPVTTYRPPFTTVPPSEPKQTTIQETNEPESSAETVLPTTATEVPETTQKIFPESDNNALKLSSNVQEVVQQTTTPPETQPPQVPTATTTEQSVKVNTNDKDITEAAESDSSQLKGVSVTTIAPTTDEKATETDSTLKPSAGTTTIAEPSTVNRPEQTAELDISQELADSLSSVLSQVAEQPTTILIDAASDVVQKVDDGKKNIPETTEKSDTDEPQSNTTPQVPEQPQPTTEREPERSTDADSATSAGTAIKTTIVANGNTNVATTEISEDTSATTINKLKDQSTGAEQQSQVTLSVAGTNIKLQSTSTTQHPDDRLNKVTPRPVTVTLVELSPIFSHRPIYEPVVIRIPSSTTTTTTTTTTTEAEPTATDKTMHVLGSGEEEEFINNKEIEKEIEKEAENEKDNDALVKRQEEIEAQTNKQTDALPTTVAESPKTTATTPKIQATYVATTTPKSNTPFQIIVQDSPVVYEDEETFNSYTSVTAPQSSSPTPFTTSPSSVSPSSTTTKPSPTLLPAQGSTLPETVVTTLKEKKNPVVITTPAIKLLPPESLYMGSDKEGTDMVNNSQEDEDTHAHKESKPLLKIDPQELSMTVAAATTTPEDSKKEPTTVASTEEATEVPATTTPATPLSAKTDNDDSDNLTGAFNTRYEESALKDEVTETPVPDTPASPEITTTEKQEATTLAEEELTTKVEDVTNLKKEETTVSAEEETPQNTDAPTTQLDEQPSKESTEIGEATTVPSENAVETTTGADILVKNVPETTVVDIATDAVATTENPIEKEPTTENQETNAPENETEGPTEQPVEKPIAYNQIAETEAPSETEKPEDTKKHEVTEKPDEEESPTETENPAETTKFDETEKTPATEKPESTEKPAETDKPVETDKPEVTENIATTEQPAATETSEETQKPTDADDAIVMEPVTGPTPIPTTITKKPVVEDKLETSSSSPVLTKIGDPAKPEEPEDPVVVLITKPPINNNLGVKDSAQDIRPVTRPRPQPSVQFQPVSSTLAPQVLHHLPSVQVQPSAAASQTSAPQHPTSSFNTLPENPKPQSVSLDPAPGENLGLEVTTVSLGRDVRKFADLCNELAFRLWGAVTVRGLHSGRSVVMSPIGVTSTLAMVFLGARGPTSGQMNDILKLDDMVTFNPHQVFRNVTESVVLGKHPGIATAAFVRELYSDRNKGRLLDFYKERAQQFYDGHVEEVNFNVISDVVRRRTNMLVKRQTRGRVPEYLRGSHIQLHPPLAAFGANIFQTDCSAASTEGRDGEMYFTVLPGSRQRRLVLVPAAVWRSDFLAGYDPHLDCTAAALGGADSLVSVVMMLPGQQGQLAPGDGVASLERRLTEPSYRRGAWGRVLRSLLPRPGLELQLPRFSHRSLLNVTAALQRMGLRDLFMADKADLRGLNGVANDLHLSDIVQVNTFSTCAEGTTGSRQHAEVYPAGGAGRAGRGDLSDVPLALRPRQGREPEIEPIAPAPRLRFDRPFIYAVRHNPTGFILHMGRFNPHLLH